MSKLISIIVFDNMEGIYRKRFINSVARQKYEKVETIVLGTELSGVQEETVKVISLPEDESPFLKKNIQQAVKMAEGEYILFAESSDVFAVNTVQKLVESLEVENTLAYASRIVVAGNKRQEAPEPFVMGLGMLMEKNKVAEILENCSIDADHRVFSVLSYEYGSGFEAIQPLEGAQVIVGASASVAAYANSEIPPVALDSYISAAAKCKNTDKKTELSNYLKQFEEDREYIFSVITYYLSNAERDNELYMYFMNSFIKNWYAELLQTNDEVLYGYVKFFQGKMEEDELLLQVMLRACGMNEEKYELMKNREVKDYVFFQNKLAVTADAALLESYSQQFDEIKSVVKNLTGIMNEQKSREDAFFEKYSKYDETLLTKLSGLNAEVRVVNVMPQGPELANLVISESCQGRMGFATILKCLKGWLAYKFHRKNQ